MRILSISLLCALLLFVVGCTKKVVVIKAPPAEKKQHVIVHSTGVNIESSNNHFKQAKKFYAKGNYKQAMKHCEKAIEFNHRNWKAHYYLGLTMQKRNQDARAIEVFGAGLKYSPDNNLIRSEIQFAIGVSWENLGKLNNAHQAYNLALVLNPDNRSAREAKKRVKIEKTLKNWRKMKKSGYDG